VHAFGDTIGAYLAVDCARLLVKLSSGLADWRESAQKFLRGSSPDHFACLPVVTYKLGEAALGFDPTGTRIGLCDTCFSRRKREKCRVPASARSTKTPPAPLPTLGYPTALLEISPRVLPRIEKAARPTLPTVPQGGAYRSAVSVGSQAGNKVVARGGPDCILSGTVDLLSRDRFLTLKRRFRGSDPVPFTP